MMMNDSHEASRGIVGATMSGQYARILRVVRSRWLSNVQPRGGSVVVIMPMNATTHARRITLRRSAEMLYARVTEMQHAKCVCVER